MVAAGSDRFPAANTAECDRRPTRSITSGYGANMTEPAARSIEDPRTTIDQLAERIEDLSRVIARQAATIERMVDTAKARADRDRAGADLPLVVELFALYADTAACAATAQSPHERDAFDAMATRVERLIVGRGGSLVTPRPDSPFDALTMEASDVTPTDDPAADRTVDGLIQPGLTVSGRSIRPATVVVRRYVER